MMPVQLSRLRSTFAALAAIALLATAGCVADDPCLEANRVLRPSPSGQRVARIYTGGCPGLGPQVLVEFRAAGGGGGVFAVSESKAAIDARWLTEDSLEVTYPSEATITQRRPVLQHGKEFVYVRFVPDPE